MKAMTHQEFSSMSFEEMQKWWKESAIELADIIGEYFQNNDLRQQK